MYRRRERSEAGEVQQGAQDSKIRKHEKSQSLMEEVTVRNF